MIDILAVFATLFGLATSLGIGAEQANAGLHHLFGMEISTTTKVILIIAISGIALCSVVMGLDKASNIFPRSTLSSLLRYSDSLFWLVRH